MIGIARLVFIRNMLSDKILYVDVTFYTFATFSADSLREGL